ncbi:MAG: bifunctional tetrahydrofolate synthase/dihydrofolate synthase [Glaciecola sp.]
MPNKHASLEQWLAYIEQTHHQSIDMGLSRCEAVFNRLNVNYHNATIVTVAGTNGKGTTCRFIEQACIKAGLSVGVYASPHIERFNERIRLKGQEVSNADICHAFCAIEDARGDISLSYFEYATLAALYLFSSPQADSVNSAVQALDVIVIEVGLGGRLDATNIVDAHIGVITSIGLDHQAYLGDTTALIAQEKAGIIKPNQYVVVGYEQAHQELLDIANKQAQHIWLRGQDFNDHSITINGHTFSFDTRTSLIPTPNVMTAITVLHAIALHRDLAFPLMLSESDLQGLIGTVNMPGRLQIIKQSPTVVLDVAHNEAAAKLLAKQMSSFDYQRCFIVIGMLTDKNVETTIDELSRLVPVKWYCTDLPSDRGEKASRFVQKIASIEQHAEAFSSVEDALRLAQQDATNNDLILVVGSFIVASECMQLIHKSN